MDSVSVEVKLKSRDIAAYQKFRLDSFFPAIAIYIIMVFTAVIRDKKS